MPDTPTSTSSPPKGLSSSPSIFAYQTRLLDRGSSITSQGRSSPQSAVGSSLSSLADASAPSTPIRRNVAKMAAGLDGLSGADLNRSPSKMGGRGHAAGAKSVGLVRGQWEAKISDAVGNAVGERTPRALKRSTFMSPQLSSSSTFAAEPASVASSRRFSTPIPPAELAQTDTSSRSSYVSSRIRQTTLPTPLPAADPDPMPITDPVPPSPALSSASSRMRPASAASFNSVLSPTSTGNSSVASGRSQAIEDTLAQARANALKRLEARKKAQAAASGSDVSDTPGEENTTIKASPAPAAAPVEIVTTPSTPQRPPVEVKRSSPFDHLFTPPSSSFDESASDETPKSRSTLRRSGATPPSAYSGLSSYVPSGLSVGPAASSSTGGKDKYGSISRTDKRRLGRHLPRIASGGEGWDGEPPAHAREPSARRVPSTLGRAEPPPSPTKEKTPTAKFVSKKKSAEVLAPSFQENRQPPPPSPTVTTTPNKRRSAYIASISKEKIGSVLQSPRQEVHGADMKGLMNAVGSLPARGASKDEGEGVTGMSNRLRLSRAVLPPSASSATVAPAPLPSRRLVQTNWMDRRRHDLAAYEYLCHVGEALQWIEGCLDEEVGFGVVEMEQGLQDGVVLAKLARSFLGEEVVKSIWTESKHRYKQTDNINHFLKFVRSVGMPETFTFELTDLYNKKNIPKVIFCLHVLSHLLARLGKAERIGNLVGQFEFTDEQLAQTQKGLQGVAMPNFGDAKATLAKEASWEPEEPEETEDEIRDRMLLECEGPIRSLQRHLRGRLARQQVSRIHSQLELAEPIVVRFQARARAALCRRTLLSEHEERIKLGSWATRIQAAARANLAHRRLQHKAQQIHLVERYVIGIQAHARGMLVRSRKGKEVNELDKARKSIVAVQALARGRLARQAMKGTRGTCTRPEVVESVSSFQAVLRGRLQRQAEAKQMAVLQAQEITFTSLQSHLRGALVRRTRKAEEQRMDDASDVIVAIQAVCRGVLSRRKKQALVKAVQVAMPTLSGLQAYARGRLAKQTHHTMQKALAKVEVAGSVGGLQAFLRTKLAKRSTMEQKKKLEFVSPDVIGFQAQARGYLARQDHNEWREYLHDPHTQGALVFLQSLIRGFLCRREFWIRSSHYHYNTDKIVKVQSLWRGRVQRRMYDKLLTGVEVDVPAIQNYMHLLNDTESDFNDQMRTEVLRREVGELVRENQTLETEVQDLETKIALIVKNKMTFEELARAKRRQGNLEGKNDSFTVAGSHDPFSGAHLDRASQRKLELFEHLFFALQTKPDYLARLIRAMERGEDERERRVVEGVVLTLFGFGHERREEYLYNKLAQLSTHTEVLLSKTIPDLVNTRFFLQPLTTACLKPVLAPFLQEILTLHVMRVNEAVELDLCTDPLEIYRRLINEEESATGIPSQKPRDRDADQVLQTDADARAHYIRHLQELRFLTAELLKTLYVSTPGIPYTVRYLAREALLALRVKYPDALDEDLTPAVARTFILPFIIPALIAPETWGITDSPIGPNERRNLAAIANLIGFIAYPDAETTDPGTKAGDRFVRVPLQEYIRTESAAFRDWVMDVASVEPLESYFEAHELFESTHEAKPILITRKEIYGMLSVLMKNIPVLTGNKPKDPLAIVLEELEGPPIEYDAKTTVSLRLTNRLAELESGDSEALVKEDWVQAKRHVLAVLRVQTGRTLYDVLVARPEETDEQRWLEEVYRDMAVEQARAAQRGMAPNPAEAGYQIESIRSLTFREVKFRAVEFCMKLERAGKISRTDAYQGLLVSIASDIRQKHHLRKMLRQSLAAMIKAHEDMTVKKIGFEESIKSYHTFIDSSMANLQKGKKRPIFMSKQYRHQKGEEKMGKRAQFGSYKYTAHDLHEKGILLGIKQFSPRQYDKIHIIMASNEVGVFSLEMTAPQSQSADPTIGHEEVRMEDLLQAQFDNELNLLLFDGMATFSINMLIHQINRKFYST